MQVAGARPVRAGCKVFTRLPVKVIDTGNESIRQNRLILTSMHDGIRRTLIGSAGFTTDVIANRNWETVISTDVGTIGDSLTAHHRATLLPRSATTQAIGN